MEGVALHFTDECIRTIAQRAIKRQTGARGLRAIMEDAMLEIMYQVPYMPGIQLCMIGKDVIENGATPHLEFREIRAEGNA